MSKPLDFSVVETTEKLIKKILTLNLVFTNAHIDVEDEPEINQVWKSANKLVESNENKGNMDIRQKTTHIRSPSLVCVGHVERK